MQRILIIDDDLMLSQLLKEHLSEEGFEVVSASMVEDGINMALQLHPDLIMLDVQLPDATGFQACGRLREDPRTRTIPIIMMTGTARFPNQQAIGKRLGANEYILKPFDVVEVGDTVHRLLGLKAPARMQTMTTEEAQATKEEMKAKLAAQSRPSAPMSMATPSVQQGIKNIPARPESSQPDPLSHLNMYKAVAAMDLRKPSISEPEPSLMSKMKDTASSIFQKLIPTPKSLIEETEETPLVIPEPEPEVEPDPSPAAPAPSLGEFLKDSNAWIPLPSSTAPEQRPHMMPLMTFDSSPAPANTSSSFALKIEAPMPTSPEPQVVEMPEPGPEPLHEAPPEPILQSISTEPIAEPFLAVEPKPAEESKKEEETESFLSSPTFAWSLIGAHVGMATASGYFLSGKIAALSAVTVILGGWALLLGVLMTMTMVMGISLDVRGAWKILGVTAAPLVLRNLLALIGALIPSLSVLRVLTHAKPFFGAAVWTHPWDIFELSMLLLLGHALRKQPGSNFKRCLTVTLLVALAGALTGRVYFRPF